MRRLLALASTLALSASCSHLAPSGGSLEDAQRVGEDFLHQLRWGNLRAASNDIRRSRRKEFQTRIEDDKLDDHLKITEYEVKDIERGPRGETAEVSGDITWYVEPSVTLVKEKFHLHLAYLGSLWMISWIEKGPVPLSETPPEPDAGASDVDEGAPAPASPPPAPSSTPAP